jgi:tetratricopeptide (TPR) repeat protein
VKISQVTTSRWAALGLFALALAVFRGSHMLSIAYNNLGSLALAREWPILQTANGLVPREIPRATPRSAPPLAQALRLDPGNERARFNAGQAAWLTGDCMAALDAWMQAAPSDKVAILQRAEGLLSLGRSEEALGLYRQIPGIALYLSTMGSRAQTAGDQRAAIERCQLSLVISPTVTAADALARIYFQRKQYAEAEGHFRSALQLSPRDAEDTYYLAWCLHRTGRGHDAVETLASAIELRGNKPWEWALLVGDWELELGNREAAMTAYQRALSWQPREGSILERIERIQADSP